MFPSNEATQISAWAYQDTENSPLVTPPLVTGAWAGQRY